MCRVLAAQVGLVTNLIVHPTTSAAAIATAANATAAAAALARCSVRHLCIVVATLGGAGRLRLGWGCG